MIKIHKIQEQTTPKHTQPNLIHNVNTHFNIHEKKPSTASKAKLDINEISNNRIHDLFSQELFTIKQFWEDLGVSENFKKLFIKVSAEMDNSHIKNYFDLEIKHLKLLSDSLIKLEKDIKTRESTISFIKNINENYISGQLSKKIVQDTVLALKNLRVISINITNHSKKIREINSYYIYEGKFEIEKLAKSFNYNKDYLTKMRYEIDFLKNSAISKYFNFSSESDPFLSNLVVPKIPNL